MVVLVIAFPSTVTWLLDKPISADDLSKIKIEIPQMEDLPPLDFGRRPSSSGLPVRKTKHPGADAPGCFSFDLAA